MVSLLPYVFDEDAPEFHLGIDGPASYSFDPNLLRVAGCSQSVLFEALNASIDCTDTIICRGLVQQTVEPCNTIKCTAGALAVWLLMREVP